MADNSKELVEMEEDDSSIEDPEEIDPSLEIGELNVEHDIPVEQIPPAILEKLLPGERVKHERTQVKDGSTEGSLYLTNFRLFFLRTKNNNIRNEIPNISIWRLKKGSKKSNTTLEVQTKDGRSLKFTLANETQVKETYEILAKFAYPPELNSLFAFTYKQYFLREAEAKGEDARQFTDPDVYDAVREYNRMGFPCPGFRITEANRDYKLCPTYPEVVVVPESISDEQLVNVAGFRSRGRFPAVVWRHPVNGSTISRSSQPNVGLKRASCSDDIAFLRALRNKSQQVLYVIDSRPKANAMANALKGGGYEQASHYKDCHPVEFHNVENIHAVRNSLLRVYKLCGSDKPYNNKHWKTALEETKWLDTIRSILVSAARIVELLHTKGFSVLIHCSDGWDRTAQACALAEMLMDPYYRTIEGFIVVIEREWLTFGHQFARRAGHGANITNPADSQRAPIFLQFIDCVWQLTQQFPTAFEFNNTFLMTLMDNLYSCQYGTFLLDCDRQRKNANLRQHTISLWYHILATKANYLNPNFTPAEVLVPVINSLTITLWSDYYLRFNPFAHDSQQVEEIIKQRMLLRQVSITNLSRGLSDGSGPPPSPSGRLRSGSAAVSVSRPAPPPRPKALTVSESITRTEDRSSTELAVDAAATPTSNSETNSGKQRKKSKKSKKDKEKDGEGDKKPRRRKRTATSSNGSAVSPSGEGNDENNSLETDSSRDNLNLHSKKDKKEKKERKDKSSAGKDKKKKRTPRAPPAIEVTPSPEVSATAAEPTTPPATLATET